MHVFKNMYDIIGRNLKIKRLKGLANIIRQVNNKPVLVDGKGQGQNEMPLSVDRRIIMNC